MTQIPKELFAAAAAQRFTPAALATWKPGIARSPRLLVPMQVDALVVRPGDPPRKWAECAITVPAAGSSVVAHELLAAPFAERAPRAPGVYLHWALPDALTRGAGSPSDPNVAFPVIPDRWLIVRLSNSRSLSRRAVTGWVIEAGGETPTVTSLDKWVEPADPDRPAEAGEKPLTALGLGDAAWAGYFDNVEKRLAFYDDLAKVDGPIAYLVAGWHSRHIDDPIGESLTSPTAFEARLEQLEWEVNAQELEAAFVYARDRIIAATKLGLETREARYSIKPDVSLGKTAQPDGIAGEVSNKFTLSGDPELRTLTARPVSWPEFTLYHGAVVGIGWPGVGFGIAPKGLFGGEVGGPPDPASVKVCVGNNLTEALATCLAHNTNHPDEARIIEAVLLGAVEELDQPDAPARIDSRLHASGFGSLPGGEITETLFQHSLTSPSSVVADASRTDPGVFAPLATPSAGSTEISKSARFAKERTLGRAVSNTATEPATLRSPTVRMGNMNSVLQAIKGSGTNGNPTSPNAQPLASTLSVKRALPRFFIPCDPVFLLQGAGRSFKHGQDTLHAESNKLLCRLSGHTTISLSPSMAKLLPAGAEVRGDDLLEHGVDNGSVPVECEDLLRELALLDPGSADIAVRAAGRGMKELSAPAHTQMARTFAVEQMAWWVSRDSRRDLTPLLAASGLSGTLPAPVAISPPIAPWVPLHLDWEVELLASTQFEDWDLKEIDFDAKPVARPAVGAPASRTLQGRALLSGGAAQVTAASVRRVMEQAQQSGGSQSLQPNILHAFHSLAAKEMITAISALSARQSAAKPDSDLGNIADELEHMDVLVGAMDRFNSKLRSGFIADGVKAPDPGEPVPADFWPVRGGFMRISRLRLVDCFGQVLDLLGSSAEIPARMDDVNRSEPLTVSGRADLIELAPRFTAPSRLWFRFVAASDDATEATDDVSPLCGYVMPNHLDGDLQFHAADGRGLGAVRLDAVHGVIWEDAPGLPTTVGKDPAVATDNAHLGAIAQGLLDWGTVDTTPDVARIDTALSSLLRIVDATLWSVDPFAHIGEEHLSLLVGHPIAVMRAMVRVEVEEPVDPASVRGMRVPVRIGALAHWHDGLLAYFVDDDYRTLHVPDPACADFARPIGPHQGFNQQASATSDYYANFAADLGVLAAPGATPVDHPYVDTTGLFWVQPGQTVMLTLLMEPHSVVHATCGFLPRKDIGMRRSWIAPGLAKLAPVFRFGPVLVDPKLIRMPVASDIRGTWSWSHRTSATNWADEAVINSTNDAQIPPDPSQGQEGWLKLTPDGK